jgi:predicted DNA helicase
VADVELNEYRDQFEYLVQLEQEEEMRRHEREMKRLTGQERENKGRCLLGMTVDSIQESIRGEKQVTFKKSNGDPLPDLEISVGDLVQISRDEPLNDDNPAGTVWSRNNYSITLSLKGKLPNWVNGSRLRLDQYVDNITFQRMLDALFMLPGLQQSQIPLREVILNKFKPEYDHDETVKEWFNKGLNTSQQEAVIQSIQAEQLHLLHGPPGTGKTVTLTEVIAQGVKRNRSVLATAPSNIAVDNLLESLIKWDLDVVRIGHPARALPRLRAYSLDHRLQDRPVFQESEAARQKALDLIEERRSLTAPTGRWRRGLSDEEIHHLADKGRSKRGVSAQKIQEMSKYLSLSEEIDQLFEKCDRLEDQAIESLLDNVDVVCATNTGAGSDLLAGHTFDWICVDEATQATEPSTLIPSTKGSKLVMAGDHRQLPPTVLSEKAAENGLSTSLFERMVETHGERVSSSLKIQYRMHRDIMQFPNDEFYDNTMVADSEVAIHTLDDIESFTPGEMTEPFRDPLRARPPIILFDTESLSGEEQTHEDTHSFFNPLEIKVTQTVLDELLNSGLDEHCIAVISPYKAQVERLRDLGYDDELEIDTVDGFQGREKDVVVMSLVRSNQSGAIGFLTDERRLNVSLTRARRKLIVIGDFSTLKYDDLYEDFKEYANGMGTVIELDRSWLEDELLRSGEV